MLPSVTRVFTLQQPLQLLNIIYTNRICQATTTDVCSESSCLSTDNTVCLGQQNKSCRVNNKYTSGLIRNRRWGIWRFPQTPCRGEGNKKMPWPKQGWVWHTHRSQGDHRSCLQITYRAWIIQAEAAGSMRTDRWELAAAALAGFILSIQARKSRAPAKKNLLPSFASVVASLTISWYMAFYRSPADGECHLSFSLRYFCDHPAGEVQQNIFYLKKKPLVPICILLHKDHSSQNHRTVWVGRVTSQDTFLSPREKHPKC